MDLFVRRSFFVLLKKILKRGLKALMKCLIALGQIIKRLLRKEKVLTVYYDFHLCPASFDAVFFFQMAEVERRKRGLESIAVIFWPRREGLQEDYGIMVDAAGEQWRFRNVVLPLMSLFPAVTSYAVFFSKIRAAIAMGFKYSIFPNHPFFEAKRNFSDLYREAKSKFAELERPWGVQAPAVAVRMLSKWTNLHIGEKKMITVTLRMNPKTPKRNANLLAWTAFARGLNKEDYEVVFVLDTDVILWGIPEELKGFTILEVASWNIEMRAALYEKAYLNLHTNTGPGILCMLMEKTRFIMYKFYVPDEPTASKHLVVNVLGYPYREGLPWATPFQKIVWDPDDLEVIQREFDEMCALIEKKDGLMSLSE